MSRFVLTPDYHISALGYQDAGYANVGDRDTIPSVLRSRMAWLGIRSTWSADDVKRLLGDDVAVLWGGCFLVGERSDLQAAGFRVEQIKAPSAETCYRFEVSEGRYVDFSEQTTMDKFASKKEYRYGNGDGAFVHPLNGQYITTVMLCEYIKTGWGKHLRVKNIGPATKDETVAMLHLLGVYDKLPFKMQCRNTKPFDIALSHRADTSAPQSSPDAITNAEAIVADLNRLLSGFGIKY